MSRDAQIFDDRHRKRKVSSSAFFSRNLTASPTVRMVSAASSGISQPNSSSNAMTSSTVSRLSAPRSSMKLALFGHLVGSTPRCSTTIFFTRSAMSLIVLTSVPFHSGPIGQHPRAIASRRLGRRARHAGRERTMQCPDQRPSACPSQLGSGYHTSHALTSTAGRPRYSPFKSSPCRHSHAASGR